MCLVRIRIEIRLVYDPTVVIFKIVYNQFKCGGIGYVSERISALRIPVVDYNVCEQRNFFGLWQRKLICSCKFPIMMLMNRKITSTSIVDVLLTYDFIVIF